MQKPHASSLRIRSIIVVVATYGYVSRYVCHPGTKISVCVESMVRID